MEDVTLAFIPRRKESLEMHFLYKQFTSLGLVNIHPIMLTSLKLNES